MALVANSSGVITGKFRIPDNIPAGTKSVVFVGTKIPANNGFPEVAATRGTARFTGIGQEQIEERQVVTTTTETRYDPLAQTFTMDRDRQICEVKLWITVKSTTRMEVQIREVENGVPTQTILARSRKAPEDQNVGNWNSFILDRPVLIRAGSEYALVVMCNDGTGQVAIAELGKTNLANSNAQIVSQPYLIGVLLSSSNASSWTPHQASDLTFQLHGWDFDYSRTVRVGIYSATAITDLMIRANIERPSPQCSVVFRITLPGGTVKTVAAEQPVALDAAVTGNIIVDAVLTGANQMTPILERDVQLLYGTVQPSGTYVGRAILAGTDVRAKVIFEAYLPGSSAVKTYVKGVDKNDTAWTQLSVSSSQAMGDGWVELTYTSATMTESMLHAKLELTGTAKYRPKVRNLRMLVY